MPPPPLECKDANQGQNLFVEGAVDSLSLRVTVFNIGDHCCVEVDTVYVTDVMGARLDSLEAMSHYGGAQLWFTLDSLATTEVRFTLKGTWLLNKGPCNFQRTFTVKINSGQVTVTQRVRKFPLEPSRDVRIELVERDGLRVQLRAAGSGEGTPEWRVTGGALERLGRLDVVWALPPEPGYYQIELSLDRGTRGVGFDALALEVT